MVAAEARGLTGPHKPNGEAEKSTLANMTPEIAAAVEMARTNTLDDRANHVITREAAKDVQLFGTCGQLPTTNRRPCPTDLV